MLLEAELLTKTSVPESGAPESFVVQFDDADPKPVGLTANGLQFFATSTFVPATDTNPGNEFICIFLFSDDGVLVEDRIDELGPRGNLDDEIISAMKAQRFAELGNVEFQDIRINPFAIERFGVMMGFVPFKRGNRWY